MAIKHVAVKATGDTGLASEWNADHVIDSDVDVAKFQLLSARIENRTTWPAGPAVGQIIFRTDLLAAYVWDGSAWVVVSNAPRPATYVVAASDSVDVLRADYFCDGINDEVEIQAAIDALPATGGRVLLLDGTFNMDPSYYIEVWKENTHVKGMGDSTVLKWMPGLGGSGVCIYATAEKVRISDVRFLTDATGFNVAVFFWVGANYGRVHDVTLDATGFGKNNYIYTASSCKHIVLENIISTDNAFAVLYMDGTEKSIIKDATGKYLAVGFWNSTDCIMEGIKADLIDVEGGSVNCMVHGCNTRVLTDTSVNTLKRDLMVNGVITG